MNDQITCIAVVKTANILVSEFWYDGRDRVPKTVQVTKKHIPSYFQRIFRIVRLSVCLSVLFKIKILSTFWSYQTLMDADNRMSGEACDIEAS